MATSRRHSLRPTILTVQPTLSQPPNERNERPGTRAFAPDILLISLLVSKQFGDLELSCALAVTSYQRLRPIGVFLSLPVSLYVPEYTATLDCNLESSVAVAAEQVT